MTSPLRTRSTRKTPTPRPKTVAPARKTTRVRRAQPTPDNAAPPSETVAATLPTETDVRLRAYEIYVEQNGQGDPIAHWLQAEQELLDRTA